MAVAYAMQFSFKTIYDLALKVTNETQEGNYDNLDEMHHLTSGFKALYSDICFYGLLQIRQSIGGAGYT